PASRAYSLVWPWIVSQGGWSSFSSRSMTPVIEFGPPRVSLPMIALIPVSGPDAAGPGPGPPGDGAVVADTAPGDDDLNWASLSVSLQPPKESRTARGIAGASARRNCVVIPKDL